MDVQLGMISCSVFGTVNSFCLHLTLQYSLSENLVKRNVHIYVCALVRLKII